MEPGPGCPFANVWLTSSGVRRQPKTGGSLLQNNALQWPTQMRSARRGPDRREGDGGERVRSPCMSRHPATGYRKEKKKKEIKRKKEPSSLPPSSPPPPSSVILFKA